MNGIVSAPRFYFTHTVDLPNLAHKLVKVAYPRKLTVVLSHDEATRHSPGHDDLPQASACVVGRLRSRPACLALGDRRGTAQ